MWFEAYHTSDRRTNDEEKMELMQFLVYKRKMLTLLKVITKWKRVDGPSQTKKKTYKFAQNEMMGKQVKRTQW